ncbi:MAG: cytochrome C [Dehalococcoidia bacterium]
MLAAALPLVPAPAEADEGMVEACAACHQMQGPSATTIEARQNRKAPALYYAGNKFREDWLIEWLQAPTRLRPAGDYPPAHVKPGGKADELDAASLTEHPAIPAKKAKVVAAHLMTLTPNDALIAAENYTPGGVSKRMGEMDFVKFKGCAACHRDTPTYGGVSGPELYTAWQRLQPAFITSYIRDPAAWEPRSLMPNKHLQDGAIHKLANYLKLIGEKPGEGK